MGEVEVMRKVLPPFPPDWVDPACRACGWKEPCELCPARFASERERREGEWPEEVVEMSKQLRAALKVVDIARKLPGTPELEKALSDLDTLLKKG